MREEKGEAVKPTGAVFDAAMRSQCSVRHASKPELNWMIRSHYLHCWPGVVVCRLALDYAGRSVGACIFALPPRETNQRYGATAWELARLWIADEMPTNTETWFISRSIKHVAQEHPDVGVLVSYADPSAGHTGIIYRASNWTPDGRTDETRKTPRIDYAAPAFPLFPDVMKKYSRRKHVPEGVETVRVPRVSKLRYVYSLAGMRHAKGKGLAELKRAAS